MSNWTCLTEAGAGSPSMPKSDTGLTGSTSANPVPLSLKRLHHAGVSSWPRSSGNSDAAQHPARHAEESECRNTDAGYPAPRLAFRLLSLPIHRLVADEVHAPNVGLRHEIEPSSLAPQRPGLHGQHWRWPPAFAANPHGPPLRLPLGAPICSLHEQGGKSCHT